MCGLFAQSFSWCEVHDFLDLVGKPRQLPPRYNVAPGQNIAVVRNSAPVGLVCEPWRGRLASPVSATRVVVFCCLRRDLYTILAVAQNLKHLFAHRLDLE